MQKNRPPIVVILGHVDHGKTTLLDALRQTDIASSEAGGITQSVRAFQISQPQLMTFIDTPGHEAFSAMRGRGGSLADIAILVVAGSEGVKPQTKESIDHINKANIPTVVVVTKSDLAEYDVNKVKQQLAENGVAVEGFGGDIPLVEVSAKQKKGLDELLEVVGLVNEMHPSQADSEGSLEAVVLESRLDPKKGPVAVVVVKNGTIETGQEIYLAEQKIGKVKALTTSSGDRVKEATPSMPVEILGLSQVPPVGSTVSTVAKKAETAQLKTESNNDGEVKIILKADVVGSLEAIQASLPKEIGVVSAATGDISESDVLLAQSTGSTLVGFNVKSSNSVAKLAEVDKVKIYTFKIIYELIDKLEEIANPQPNEKIVGQAQVLAEFEIDKQHVAGCKCTEGSIKRSALVRIGEIQAKVKSLRISKTEVNEVKVGQEFGAIFSPEIDFKVGDTIIAIENYG